MKDVSDYIRANAIAHPEAIAIIQGDRKLSYKMFFNQVEETAKRLECIKPRAKVLVDLDQGIEAYILITAILFATGTYCPVNRSAPKERKSQILLDFDPDIIIVKDNEDNMDMSDPRVFTISNLLTREEKKDFADKHDENHIAYVIYTSGSTGVPKGVMINRKSLNKFLDWSIGAYTPKVGDIWAQFSYLSFDLSIVDIFTCLCSGAALLCVDQIGDKLRPAKVIEKFKVTIWHSVPSLIDLIFGGSNDTTEDLSSLRLMSFCGEPLTQRHVELAFAKHKDLVIFNTYGPTEGTLFCTVQELTFETYENFVSVTMSIGEPISGWQFEIEATDDPDIFELILYGDYIGTGYLGNQNDTRFYTFNKAGKTHRAFRTGDLIRQYGGKFYFYSRVDRQVKINGYRVEPAEIDVMIHQELQRVSYTIAFENALYTFIEGSSDIDSADVKNILKTKIENYKVPKEVYTISNLPRTPNLKTDVSKLKEMIIR